MFQFTTTTLINSAYAVDVLGNSLLDNTGNPVARYKDNSGASFTVVGTGTFVKGNIESVYKRSYAAGVKEQATLTVVQQTSGTILRLTVDVKLVGAAQSDYVNFSYQFKQPLTVDIVSTGTAADDATELAKVLNKIKTEFGRSLFTASASGAVVTFTARTNDQRFNSILLQKIGAVPLNTLTPEITQVAKGVVTVPGRTGFGDDAWMLKSVILPTYQNTRHFGTLKDERPVLGGNYSQYTLRYKVRAGEDGVWMADDKSVTTHVFWVAANQVAAFEAALETTLGAQIPGGIAITAAGNATSLVNELTLQLTVSGAVGNVTYASSDTDLATISATGLVTAKAAPALGDVVLTATDSFGNVASITIEIKAA